MTENEAVELYMRKPKGEVPLAPWNEATKVVSKLGYLRLAIHQAAAYIDFTKFTIPQFLEKYEAEALETLKSVMEYTPRLWNYGPGEDGKPLSAFATREMSLKQIGNEKHRKRAERFLTLSAFLDPTAINQDLFINIQRDGQHWPDWQLLFSSQSGDQEAASDQYEISTSWNLARYEAAVNTLCELSLVENTFSGRDGKWFSLYPLVKDWLQLRVDRREQPSLV
jgi:hypothetical protein